MCLGVSRNFREEDSGFSEDQDTNPEATSNSEKQPLWILNYFVLLLSSVS